MADIYGFRKYKRELPSKRKVEERIDDYKEIYAEFSAEDTNKQAARCMDCGIPFCHNGCPLGNIIPDFNDAVFRESWKEAYEILASTNNFPEFTGRICPAPCEASCVLGINNDPVTIEHIEKSIIERAFENDWVKAINPEIKTEKTVAIVGSGPAGLAAAEQLHKVGHAVTVFERNGNIGGLLRYGIPDFKLEKSVIDRRLNLMKEGGIIFKVNANVGVNVDPQKLVKEFDAVLLTGGSTIPRDLPIPGRNLSGVHFAMDFLEQKNKELEGIWPTNVAKISAKGKNVVIIGGGDTGADCVGTSNREKAKTITQIELLSQPPEGRAEQTPWPLWPMMLRTSSSHEEGCDRKWALLTKEFIGNENGELTGIKIVEIEWVLDPVTQRSSFKEIEETERQIPCELALLAMGFIHPQHEGMITDLNLKLDDRGNIATTDYKSSQDKIFAAGDMRRGQSLVVWAISEGREAAIAVDKYLNKSNHSALEGKEKSLLEV